MIRWLAACLMVGMAAHAAEPNVVPSSASAPSGGQVAEDRLEADTRQMLLKRFTAASGAGAIRVHELNMVMDAYADSLGSPNLRLNKMWVSDQGTLLEVEGLPVANRTASAVIREDTLTLRHKDGMASVDEVEGAFRIEDRKGGSALVIKPGERVLLRFARVDDLHPMRLYHLSPEGSVYVYFDNIDPRFKERYAASYQKAASAEATPEDMKDFLVAFARNDPDKKAPEIFLKLINRMRAQNTFEGYYHAYLLLQAPEDANKAMKLARTDRHKAMMEHMAVQTLADKTRLFDFDLNLRPISTQTEEGRCMFRCRYNFSAFSTISGNLAVKQRASSPIKLRHGAYRLNFNVQVVQPRHKVRESRWLGNFNGPETGQFSETISVTLRPPDYRIDQYNTLGRVMVSFVERGSMGGAEASYANSNARVTLSLQSVELLP